MLDQISKRERFLFSCIAAMLLGSCSESTGPRLFTRDEVIDIADSSASLAIEESERIKRLEARIEELEAKVH